MKRIVEKIVLMNWPVYVLSGLIIWPMYIFLLIPIAVGDAVSAAFKTFQTTWIDWFFWPNLSKASFLRRREKYTLN